MYYISMVAEYAIWSTEYAMFKWTKNPQYTTAFCALVWINMGTFRLIKKYSEVPED